MASITIVLLLAFIVYSGANCPDGFMPWHEGYCYKIVDDGSDGFIPYSKALGDCTAAGGELISIHSEMENRRVMDVATSLGKSGPGWIGLHCDAGPHWTDGTPVDYWSGDATTCPDGYAGFVQLADGGWHACSTAQRNKALGLCRHPQRNGGRCFDFEEVIDKDAKISYCVGIFSDVRTWSQAEDTCKKAGSHLISIHHKSMNDEIANRVRALNSTAGGFRIGLNSTVGSGILDWVDGSSVDYVNYAKGFPADVFGHCTAMESVPEPGPWITTQCESSSLPFICNRPAPAIIGPSGCPVTAYFKNSGIIYSPTYPQSMQIHACDYVLSVPEGKRVQVSIDDLNTNACCDKLSLYDGSDATTPFATLAGRATQTLYNSTSNVVKMSYLATDGTFVRGWKVSFSAV